MNTKYDEILKFKCPRWNELPEIELYMDQVVNLLDKKLCILADDPEKTVTSTMINNYVKQKIITPPQKKKYDRKHVAYLFIILLLKKAFSVSEISAFLEHLNKNENTGEVFDNFCEQIEYCIAMLFGNLEAMPQSNGDDKITETVAFAFACKLYAQILLKKDDNDE
ncbi:MAG: DUF1836 domain-containing protein [Clostridia bacterium]|nr:DUF1836 domain-containing protein [Clostridia bacterium]